MNSLSTVFELSDDYLFVANAEGKLTNLSSSIYRKLNLSKADLLNKHFLDLMNPDDAVSIHNNIQTLQDGVDHFNVVSSAKNKEGRTIFIEWNINRDTDSKDILGIGRDVSTKLNEVRSEREKLESLITHTPAAVAMLDNDIRYIIHSKRWLTDYGLGDIDIIGKSHYEVFPDIPQRWKDDHQNCLKGNILVNPQDHWQRDDGTDVYIAYEIRPWYNSNGTVGGIIFYTQVITDYIETQKELEAKVTELRRSNLDLEQFAYVASHDLQEPLRMIGNFSELLKIQYGPQLDSRALEYIDISIGSAKKMKELISNLLNYSRVGRLESDLKMADIESMVQSQISEHQLMIQDTAATVDYSELPDNLLCVPSQLEMVFHNLINNALKFNKSSKPKVHVSYEETKTDHVFRVEDNGIGISKDNINKIFLAFRRLHKTEYPGTGIGLALCKKIIERHKGHINVASSENGSIFTFTISKSLTE